MTHGSFFSAYVAGEPRALAFWREAPLDPAARKAATCRAAERRVAPPLLEALAALDRELPASPARRAHLAALGRPGTAVVVTGQQVGLFLGPLYTFYKAATAVASARALERESGVPCVPLFWLQTEDHDFPEIDHCLLPGPPGGPPVRLAIGDGGVPERRSVAHRRLGEDVQAALAGLEAVLGDLPHAGEVLARVRRHYQPGRTLAAAFAGLLAELFAEEGLLFLDPRLPAVARLLAPVYRRALDDAAGIADALAERSRALRAAGFAEQVHVRPGSPLVFFHEDNPEGPRYRLDPAAGGFRLVGGDRTVALAELRQALETDPLRFSTSALLRPVVQDTLLPTAAYVGGPGEIGYFAQVGALEERFGLCPPLLLPRARLRLVEPAVRTLLRKLELRPADAERPLDDLLRRTGASASGEWPPPEALRDRLLGEFSRALEAFERGAPALDANLCDPARKTRETVTHACSRLVDRYARALGERDHTLRDRLTRLRAALCPDDTPQERIYGLSSYCARAGTAALTRAVLGAIVPFSAEVVDLELEVEVTP